MATIKQIEANRRNALKSTGPKTPGGKAAVRLNALRHGLRAHAVVLPGENPGSISATLLRSGSRMAAPNQNLTAPKVPARTTAREERNSLSNALTKAKLRTKANFRLLPFKTQEPEWLA